jgi:hypothetical protein
MIQPSEVFDGLDAREIDYVKARANAKSNRQALKDARLSQGWLSNRDSEDLFNRAMAFKTNVAFRAQLILEEAVEEAARIKASGLHSRDERIKQSASTEILDRHFGKPPQKQEISGLDGGKIIVKLVNDD